MTALFIAVYYNHTAIVALLLGANANVNTFDNCDHTAYFYSSDERTRSLLLGAGADVHAWDTIHCYGDANSASAQAFKARCSRKV